MRLVALLLAASLAAGWLPASWAQAAPPMSPAQAAPAAAAAASEPEVIWTVANRDTLIGFAQGSLLKPGAWAEVAKLNRLANPNLILPGQQLRVPLRLLRGEEIPAKLLSVEGQVSVDGQPVQAGADLRTGQQLRTGAQSFAVVQLADGSTVRLSPATQAALSEHRRIVIRQAQVNGSNGEGTFAAAMRLLQGSLDLVAAKLGRVKPLEVSTPVAVIGVRGTEYRVHHDAALASRTEVLEGKVRADLQATNSKQADGADVSAGQGTHLVPGKPVRPVDLPPAPDLSNLPRQLFQPQLPLNIAPLASTTNAGSSPLKVQLAADAQFGRLLREWRAQTGQSLALEGVPEGQWHVRISRVDDATGLEGRAAAASFDLSLKRVLQPGPIPRPQTGNREAGKVILEFTDEWPDSDMPHYRVQVARDEAFSQIVWEIADVANKSVPLPVVEPGAYSWRVARLPRSAADPRGESAWSVGKVEVKQPVAVPTGRCLADSAGNCPDR